MAGGKSGESEERDGRPDGLFAIELGSGQLISAGSSVIVFLILLSWSAFAKLCAGLLKSQLRVGCQFFLSGEMSSSNFASLTNELKGMALAKNDISATEKHISRLNCIDFCNI